MATLMQKDALLEGVSQALGHVMNKDSNNKEITTLLDMKTKIYCSNPEEIDFDEMGQYIKTIIEKYKG